MLTIITLARKPLSEKSIVANIQTHGTGALNVRACRIEGPPWAWGTQTDIRGAGYGSKRPSDGHVLARNVKSDPSGRWPANLVLSFETEESYMFKVVEDG